MIMIGSVAGTTAQISGVEKPPAQKSDLKIGGEQYLDRHAQFAVRCVQFQGDFKGISPTCLRLLSTTRRDALRRFRGYIFWSAALRAESRGVRGPNADFDPQSENLQDLSAGGGVPCRPIWLQPRVVYDSSPSISDILYRYNQGSKTIWLTS